MTPTDLTTLREKAETMLDETHGQTCPFCTLARDILSLLSTLEAEQQQRARLEQENERLREAVRTALDAHPQSLWANSSDYYRLRAALEAQP